MAAHRLVFAEPFTIEMWLRPTRATNTVSTFLQRRRDFTKGQAQNGFIAYLRGTDAGVGSMPARLELWGAFDGGPGSAQAQTQAPVETGPNEPFTHVVFTFIPKDAMYTYIDGSQASRVGLNSGAISPEPMVHPLLIADNFLGFIDELAFYDQSLPQDRIRLHYDLGKAFVDAGLSTDGGLGAEAGADAALEANAPLDASTD